MCIDHPHILNRIARYALIVLAGWTFCTAHAAEPEPPATTTLDPSILIALNAPDHAVREQATFDLLQNETITPDMLIPLYEQATTTEQRHRLLTVAEHHFIRQFTPRYDADDKDQPIPPENAGGESKAAMGVFLGMTTPEQMPEVGRNAVVVSVTIPGFPGHAYLRTGDLILATNDQPVTTSNLNEFIVRIHSYKPGQSIKLQVLRDERVITISMRLTSQKALSNLYDDLSGVRTATFRQLQEPYRKDWLAFRNRMTANSPPQTLVPRPAGQ